MMLTPDAVEALRPAVGVLATPVGFLQFLEDEIDKRLVHDGLYDSRNHHSGARIPEGIARLIGARYREAGWKVEIEAYRHQQAGNPGYDDPDGTVRGYAPELDYPAAQLLIQCPTT